MAQLVRIRPDRAARGPRFEAHGRRINRRTRWTLPAAAVRAVMPVAICDSASKVGQLNAGAGMVLPGILRALFDDSARFGAFSPATADGHLTRFFRYKLSLLPKAAREVLMPTDIPYLMTPLHPIVRDPASSMVQRCALMQQPAEAFRNFFHGRVPTLSEKLQFIEQAVQRMNVGQVYQNDTYTVEVIPGSPFIHLDIRRNDGQPCRSWRELQQIKNELVGPDHEAVELYPAECRLVDTAHQYHLWVVADPGFRFPLGFRERFVLDEPIRVELDGTGLHTTQAHLVPEKHSETAVAA
jgi:hypothetical protein